MDTSRQRIIHDSHKIYKGNKSTILLQTEYGRNDTSLIVVQHIWKAPGCKKLVKDFKILNLLPKSSIVSSKKISLELLLYSKLYVPCNLHTV